MKLSAELASASPVPGILSAATNSVADTLIPSVEASPKAPPVLESVPAGIPSVETPAAAEIDILMIFAHIDSGSAGFGARALEWRTEWYRCWSS